MKSACTLVLRNRTKNCKWQIAQDSIIANTGDALENVHSIIMEGKGHTAIANVEAFSGAIAALITLDRSQDFMLVCGKDKEPINFRCLKEFVHILRYDLLEGRTMFQIIKSVLVILLLAVHFSSLGIVNAQEATVLEEKIFFKTYPFNDPNPVPIMGKIYPYFKFNGYSINGKQQAWNMVTLENPYIKVVVAPEIGGKLWGAVEKEKDQAFIYYNNVVKFRDIAMRGPWTSGGIEFNFGVIGHTPTTSTPVDYLVRENDDGSVSCFVGTMDLPSRLEWRVEIKLHPDKAYFETNSFVFNPTVLKQPCYHWMNAAADASSDLHFYYPDPNEIDHGGELGLWPVNDQGRDVSSYANNNFGGSKSYHILGALGEYFGGYWKNTDFGYGHWSPFDEKPGKKLWIWSLARDGEIWRDLLTDKRDNLQYIEIQTGLLYNQAGGSSTRTPFKHTHFAANESHSFQEIWYPIKDIGGMVDGSLHGSLNVTVEDNKVKVGICALQPINDDLVIKSAGMEIYRKHIQMTPSTVYFDSVQVSDSSAIFDISLGDGKLEYSTNPVNSTKLSRPLKANEDFDWDSAYGLYTTGLEQYRQRAFMDAQNNLLKCLEKEANFNPALALLAEICYRFLEYEKGLEYAKKALANDAYDGEANFIYGVINRELGNIVDAKDGFSWASRDLEYRSVAFQQLAEIALMENKLDDVAKYASKSLDFNRRNINSLKVRAVAFRLGKKPEQAETVLDAILGIDPLNYFARFEKYLLEPNETNLAHFQNMIRNELPHETYLENMLFYYNNGCLDEAKKMLNMSPKNATINYWLAYLNRENSADKDFLILAEKSSPFLVFPHRQETIKVMSWAAEQTESWKPEYYLGLLYNNFNQKNRAAELLNGLGDKPDYAPFYLIRYQIAAESSEQKLHDLKMAIKLDPEQWRAWTMLSKFYLNLHDYKNALENSKSAYKKFSKEKYQLAMDYSQALLYNGHYKECLDILENTTILPYEGARYGQVIYKRTCLMYAADMIKKKKYEKAKKLADNARLYPENLGAGKPYNIDERLEDYVVGLCFEKMGDKNQADVYFEKVAEATKIFKKGWSSVNYFSLLALKKLGQNEKADQLLQEWQMAKSEDGVVLRWVKAKLKKNSKEIEQILKAGVDDSGGTPWNPSGADAEFRIVLDVSSSVGE